MHNSCSNNFTNDVRRAMNHFACFDNNNNITICYVIIVPPELMRAERAPPKQWHTKNCIAATPKSFNDPRRLRYICIFDTYYIGKRAHRTMETISEASGYVGALISAFSEPKMERNFNPCKKSCNSCRVPHPLFFI